jgi:hypothetical protein
LARVRLWATVNSSVSMGSVPVARRQVRWCGCSRAVSGGAFPANRLARGLASRA